MAVTGADGFIGKALCDELVLRGFKVRRLVRKRTSIVENSIAVGNIGGSTDWSEALKGVKFVIHCAGRAHKMNDKSDARHLYYETNLEGTRQLVNAALKEGVQRFIFLSSIKVNGEKNFFENNRPVPFSPFDLPSPEDDYGLSKWETEKMLWNKTKDTSLDLVIIRPPLVYGKGVKGNFLKLIKASVRGGIFPFGLIENKRSFVALSNLIDLLIICITHSGAKNKTFLVSDGNDLSIKQLVIEINKNLFLFGVLPRVLIIPLPIFILKFFARLFQKQSVLDRLIGDLQVDITYTRQILGWTPPVNFDVVIREILIDFELDNKKII